MKCWFFKHKLLNTRVKECDTCYVNHTIHKYTHMYLHSLIKLIRWVEDADVAARNLESRYVIGNPVEARVKALDASEARRSGGGQGGRVGLCQQRGQEKHSRPTGWQEERKSFNVYPKLRLAELFVHIHNVLLCSDVCELTSGGWTVITIIALSFTVALRDSSHLSLN